MAYPSPSLAGRVPLWCPSTPKLALAASKLSLRHALPMADAMILATAQAFEATLWTQDAQFKAIAGVKYIVKK